MSRKKQIRSEFRQAVFARDRYRCVTCGHAGYDRQEGEAHRSFHDGPREKLIPLDAHHITDRNEMPNGGYVVENGIALCDEGCHRLAEVFHQTGTPYPGFSPDELYALIGSTHDEAIRASEQLK